jgi:hypothetical protein
MNMSGFFLEFTILSFVSFGMDEENWNTYIFNDSQLVCGEQVANPIGFFYRTSSL